MDSTNNMPLGAVCQPTFSIIHRLFTFRHLRYQPCNSHSLTRERPGIPTHSTKPLRRLVAALISFESNVNALASSIPRQLPRVNSAPFECVSSGTIRRPKWIFRQFKEETRRLSSAKSSFVTQKWRSATRNCGLRNF